MDDAPVSISQSKHDRYVLVHAVLGSVATLIVAPAAILLGRYARKWRHWNHVHTALNVFTLILIVITFALGNAALKDPNQYFGPQSDLHHKLGLAAFLIVCVQAILGLLAKVTHLPSFNYVTIQTKRNPLRLFHIFFGIATIAILYTQVYTGFDEWDESSDSMTTTPRGIKIAFWVLLAVEVFAYVAGWAIMEPLARRRRSRELAASPETKEARDSTNSRTPFIQA